MTAFSWLGAFLTRSRVVETPEILRVGRDGYTLYLDARHLWLCAEMLDGTPDCVIYRSTVRDITDGTPFQEAPHAEPAMRNRAVRALEAYFRRQGVRYLVQ